MQRTIESFMRECYQCSKFHHLNVVQFLGVLPVWGETAASGYGHGVDGKQFDIISGEACSYEVFNCARCLPWAVLPSQS